MLRTHIAGAILGSISFILLVGLLIMGVWWPEKVFAQPINITAQTVVVNTLPGQMSVMPMGPVAVPPPAVTPLPLPQVPPSRFSQALLGLAGQLEGQISRLKGLEWRLQNATPTALDAPWFYQQLEESRLMLTSLREDGEAQITANTVWMDDERAAVSTFRQTAEEADKAYRQTLRAYQKLVNLAERTPPPQVRVYPLPAPSPAWSRWCEWVGAPAGRVYICQ